MVGIAHSLIAAAAIGSVAAFPLKDIDSILGKAAEMNKRGMFRDEKVKRAFKDLPDDHVNKRGLSSLLTSTLAPVQNLLQTLDLPTPQAVGLAAVPDAAHPYKAPGPTDVRGLCPTLNTMANHGYISRNGITTFAEAANACQQAFGFAFDICTGLSALGLLAGGDILSGKMSIGGPDARVPNTLGTNPGINVHGPFEIDGSITRSDTYFGDNHSFNKTLFTEWNATAVANNGLFDFKTMSANQLASYENSKATNPEATFGVKYFVVSYAERVFIPQALPNGTTLDVADYKNIAPFFLEERFPPRWFRRDNPYTAADTVVDVLNMYLTAPVTLGGNVNGEFVPLDLTIPTASPDALACFLVKEVFDALPGFLAAKATPLAPLYNVFIKTVFSTLFGSGGDITCDLSSYGV